MIYKMNTIKQMPPDSRVWVYQSNRMLSEAEVDQLMQQGKLFVESWAAHGAALKASFDILYNRFIVVAVDEAQALASGCSIDKSLAFIQSLEKDFELQLLDRMQVAYRTNDNSIQVCSFAAFEKLAVQGTVNAQTIVFNNMVTTKSQLDSSWEVPLKESWQSRVLN